MIKYKSRMLIIDFKKNLFYSRFTLYRIGLA